ncbi:unnamed protein product [Gongylonema pulchrum]|uniref:Uncharacterized protein n=1 Tax=Gongylonema pulchrum TaxID=637853 RepID=A0A3P7NAM2_9BILA|nr:unnamed protein product [Gongylonema pulchrum]
MPCARKKDKYTKDYCLRKLREIEKQIASYNALSDNKIATIHMSSSGEMKMYGSKFIVNACLHSSISRNLEKEYSERREFKEEDTDDEVKYHAFSSALPFCPSAVCFCYSTQSSLLPSEMKAHSIVDLERDILKYAYNHYAYFMEYHFGIRDPGSGEGLQGEEDRLRVKSRSQQSIGIQSESAVLRIRYERMSEDFRMIMDAVNRMQNHSTCRAMVLLVDERNKWSVAGDKTLIAALVNSNIPQCVPEAASFDFDNVIFLFF